MLVQATTFGRQHHRSVLRRMTGIDMKTARMLKSKNDGISPAVIVDDKVGSLLVALQLAVVIDKMTKRPRKLTDKMKADIDRSAVESIKNDSLKFHGPAKKNRAALIEAAERAATEEETAPLKKKEGK